MVAFANKELAQPVLAEVGFDRLGKAPLTRNRESPPIEIGAEDLKLRPQVATLGLFQQQDADRIGLLAGGAPRDPDADRVPLALAFEQPRNDAGGQRSERLAVAEEGRDRDQKVANSACASSAVSRR